MKRSGTLALAGALFILGSVTMVPAAGATAEKSGCTVIKAPAAHASGKLSAPKQKLDPKKTYLVTMQTNCGTIVFKVDQKQSPNDAASFVALVQRGFFNGTIFHRVVPGFVIQGGDPTATGTGGPGYSTVDKPPARAAYTHGVVAMAKTQLEPAGTAGSQFFIVTVPSVQLPPDYAIIGKVVKGLDVVDQIGKFGDANDPQGRPTKVVEIQRATVKNS